MQTQPTNSLKMSEQFQTVWKTVDSSAAQLTRIIYELELAARGDLASGVGAQPACLKDAKFLKKIREQLCTLASNILEVQDNY